MKKTILVLALFALLLPLSSHAKGAQIGLGLSLPGYIVPEINLKKSFTDKLFGSVTFGLSSQSQISVIRFEASAYYFIQENLYAGLTTSTLSHKEVTIFSPFAPAIGIQSPLNDSASLYFEADVMWMNYVCTTNYYVAVIYFMPVLKAGVTFAI